MRWIGVAVKTSVAMGTIVFLFYSILRLIALMNSFKIV